MKKLIHISLLLGGMIPAVSFAQNDTISFAEPEKLGETVNSKAEESLPILSADGKSLYFARTFHHGNKGGKQSGQDIWMSTKDGSDYSDAENVEVLNDKRSNVVIGISKDGKRLYQLNQFPDEKETVPGISVSEKTTDSWATPTPVAIPELDVKSTFYSAFVSPYEDFILWSLPASDSTGNDLYVSISGDRGQSWSAPFAMGNVNSEFDEISPYFDAKNDLLFYSVNNNGDPFNYDIYYSKKLDESWTNWSSPVKAGNGINSSGFEAYFFVNEDGLAYFSSNRVDSLSNIYTSELIITEIEEEVEDTVEVEDDPVLIIETAAGTATNRELGSMTKEELTAATTKIRFVYFDFDHFDISRKYIEVLDDAAEILDKYPELTLVIEGHTDAVGTDAYNKQLSVNRANSAKEFMLINGVEPSRIEVEGYGESKPYASNYTAEGRAKNRRVELRFKED